MYTQIDKGRHAIPCEAKLKAPYTRQASRIDYVNAIAGRLDEQPFMCIWSPDKETPEKGCDRASHRRAAHPVGWAHTAHRRDESDESRGVPSTSMGTVEQATMNAGLHRMLVRQPGLFSVVLVPAGHARPRPQRELHWCGAWTINSHLLRER